MQTNKIYRRSLIILVLLITTINLFAQTEEHTEVVEHKKGIHSITLVMANAFLSNSFNEQTDNTLIVPVFGFNYDYQFNRQWGAGLHSDLVLQQFKVEQYDSKTEIIRENPIGVVAILFFKPSHRWKILGGYGIEIEKEKNLQLVRIGVEYGIPLPKSWELNFNLEFDFKINYYSNPVLGIGFVKIFSGS